MEAFRRVIPPNPGPSNAELLRELQRLRHELREVKESLPRRELEDVYLGYPN